MEAPSNSELLKQACGLLERLHGVSVLASGLTEAEATFQLSVSEVAALEQLHKLALAANASADVLPPQGKSQMHGERPGALYMQLSAGTTPRDTITRGALQLLCIHLVWHLHRIGQLSSERANPMLECLSAARVGI